LGLCLVVNAPWVFWACWNVIQYWIDPNSRHKIKFISTTELPEYIHIDDIPVGMRTDPTNWPNSIEFGHDDVIKS
jgi:hypothetical protein